MWLDIFGLAKTYNRNHGNSKKSNKTQHGYVIFDKRTGEILEFGISGQKLNKNGSSPRITQKLRKKYNNNPNIGGKVINKRISASKGKTARQNALNWEQGKVNAYSISGQRSGNFSTKQGPLRQIRPTPKM